MKSHLTHIQQIKLETMPDKGFNPFLTKQVQGKSCHKLKIWNNHYLETVLGCLNISPN